MDTRLRLIWFALTAPKAAIENRAAQVQAGIDAAEAEKIRAELDALNTDRWSLVGVSVEYSGDVDSTAIREFMARAPGRIRRLLPHPARPLPAPAGEDGA